MAAAAATNQGKSVCVVVSVQHHSAVLQLNKIWIAARRTGRNRCRIRARPISFFGPIPMFLHYSNYTAERHYSIFFSSGHINKKIITQVAITKKQIVIVVSCKQAVSILPCEAKYTLMELFCHQMNIIGWTGHMTSFDSMTVSFDCDVCKWFSLIDK